MLSVGGSRVTTAVFVLALMGQGLNPNFLSPPESEKTKIVQAGLFSFLRDVIQRLLGGGNTNSSDGSTGSGESQSTSTTDKVPIPADLTKGQEDPRSLKLAPNSTKTLTDPENKCKTVAQGALPSELANESTTFGSQLYNYDPAFYKTGVVGNAAPLEIFVPASNACEWNSFVQGHPPTVTINDCAAAAAISCPPGTPTVALPVSLSDCLGTWCGGAKNRNKNVQPWYRTTANWLCIRQGYTAGACDWDINPNLQGGRYCAFNNEGGSGCDPNNSGINPMIRVHCANPPPPPPPSLTPTGPVDPNCPQ